jgi:LacI family transcriptional regulator
MAYYSTSRYTTIGTLGKDEYIYEKILNEKKADAVIVINGYLEGGAEIIKRYKKAGIHIVFVEGKGEWGHRVHYDNVVAAEIAVNHLADKGHKKIGLLIGNYDHVESMRERYDGFRNAMKKRGLKMEKGNIFVFYDAFAGVSKKALDQFMDNKIDAVYAGTGDEDAYTLMKEAAGRGLKIPGDLAVVGQDDSKLAEIVGLTTIKQPITEMGRKAVEIAVNAIDNIKMKKMKEEVFYPELVVRKTT